MFSGRPRRLVKQENAFRKSSALYPAEISQWRAPVLKHPKTTGHIFISDLLFVIDLIEKGPNRSIAHAVQGFSFIRSLSRGRFPICWTRWFFQRIGHLLQSLAILSARVLPLIQTHPDVSESRYYSRIRRQISEIREFPERSRIPEECPCRATSLAKLWPATDLTNLTQKYLYKILQL